MFAYQLTDLVNPGDLIVTADCDTFIMNPSIFEHLRNPKYKGWIFDYELSVSIQPQFFRMDYIAFEASALKIQQIVVFNGTYGVMLVTWNRW